MAPNFSKLDSIQRRSINLAKQTTYKMRAAANRSVERNVVFSVGINVEEIQRLSDQSVIAAYIRGFETTVPERGIQTVQQKYNLSPDTILQRYGSPEAANYVVNISSTLEEKIIELQYSGFSRTFRKRQMRLEFERLGLTGNPYRLEAIFNTATTAAFNAGRIAGFNLPQNQERIWGYRYQTQKDERVRDTHRAMQGFTRDKNDPLWAVYTPPNGYNCRCYLEVLTRPANETGVPSEEEVPVLPDPGFRGPLNAS